MLINKKKLWFLIAIPLYVLYCYLSVLFWGREFRISDILCLSVFAVSAVVIMVCKKKAVTIVCLLLLHLALIGVYLFLNDYLDLTLNELYVYALFCFPSLVMIYMVEDLHNKSSGTQKNVKKAAVNDSNKQLFFEALCFLPIIIALISFIIKREFASFKFDSTLIFLALILVLHIILLIAGHIKKARILPDFVKLIYLSAAVCVCHCLVYSFYAYQFVQDKVYLAFPMITVLMMIFEEHSKPKATSGSEKSIYDRD